MKFLVADSFSDGYKRKRAKDFFALFTLSTKGGNRTSVFCEKFATHDPEIELLEEEAPYYFKNFYFESYVVGSDITFDYLLRSGISNTKNASLLIRKLDLI